MALHGVDVAIFTDLDRSYQTEQDPREVRLTFSLSLSLSLIACVRNCVRRVQQRRSSDWCPSVRLSVPFHDKVLPVRKK